MTRLQAKEFLISLGVTDPSSEQIDTYLNNLNGEVQREKSKADQYKKDSEKVVELQKQLDELNNANLSDIEKANKETETFKNQVAELQKQIATMNTKNSLLSNGIKEDEADKIIESLNSGTFDAGILGQIIADRTKSAVADFEKQSLANTPNPNGVGADGEPEKTELDKVIDIAKGINAPDSKSADIINAYK